MSERLWHVCSSAVHLFYVDCLLLVVLQQWGCLLDLGGKSCKFLNLLQSFMFDYISIYSLLCCLDFWLFWFDYLLFCFVEKTYCECMSGHWHYDGRLLDLMGYLVSYKSKSWLKRLHSSPFSIRYLAFKISFADCVSKIFS